MYWRPVVIHPVILDAVLAAAVGDEPALIAELRSAFFASANYHTASLAAATLPEGWSAAANRLHSLAASFGALSLIKVASEALRTPENESAMVRKVKHTISAFEL